jgi:glycine cleavage system aminomethyltransferase T
VLRVEKGYLTGAEMNGQTTPMDLGLEALVARNPGCIGGELLDRPPSASRNGRGSSACNASMHRRECWPVRS